MDWLCREALTAIGQKAAIMMECEVEDHHYIVKETTVEVDSKELVLTVTVKFEVDDGN